MDALLEAAEAAVRKVLSESDLERRLDQKRPQDGAPGEPADEDDGDLRDRLDHDPRARRLIMSVEEAERTVGLGHTKFYELLNSGEIASFSVGRRRLVPVAALDAWIERKLAEASGGGPR